MTGILVLGGGRIGGGIAELLSGCPGYQLVLADRDDHSLDFWRAMGGAALVLDTDNPERLAMALSGQDIVINALPVGFAVRIAEAARKAGTHYLDLSEDIAARQRIRKIARNAGSAFIPGCGLAPGFVGILAFGLAQGFAPLHELHIRVGALPEKPEGGLNYALTWSAKGLINQYCNPGEAIRGGRVCATEPLGDLETLTLNGASYEAFNTSGGLGTLTESLAGKVSELEYKTIRYPGHCALMRLLVRDLKLGRRRDLLEAVLKNALPEPGRDMVLIQISVRGVKNGRDVREIYGQRLSPVSKNGHAWSAIRLATASSVAAVADLLAQGQIPSRGFVRQEDIGLDLFLANRFGHSFAQEAHRAAA